MNIIGFVFEHEKKDYSLWTTDAISKADQKKIQDIIDNYCFTGSSVRNVYKGILKLAEGEYK